MNGISFTSGIVSKLNADYYNLELFNKDGQLVYVATLSRISACNVVSKYYPKIKAIS